MKIKSITALSGLLILINFISHNINAIICGCRNEASQRCYVQYPNPDLSVYSPNSPIPPIAQLNQTACINACGIYGMLSDSNDIKADNNSPYSTQLTQEGIPLRGWDGSKWENDPVIKKYCIYKSGRDSSLFSINRFGKIVADLSNLTIKERDSAKSAGTIAPISVCNLTFRDSPVNIILATTNNYFKHKDEHDKYVNVDFLFGRKEDPSIQGMIYPNSTYSSEQPLLNLHCQVGWQLYDDQSWFTPKASWSSYTADDFEYGFKTTTGNNKVWTELTSFPKSARLPWARINPNTGGTIWLVPNIRMEIPKYSPDQKSISPFLFVPVASSSGFDIDALVKGCPDQSCSACGMCLINGFLPFTLRGKDRDQNLIGRLGTTSRLPFNLTLFGGPGGYGGKNNEYAFRNTYKDSYYVNEWFVTQDGYTPNESNKETLDLINKYFNYVFLDTVKNESDTTYFIATTDASIENIIEKISNSPNNTSVLLNFIKTKKLSVNTPQAKDYTLQLFNTSNPFNADNYLTINANSSNFKHRVTQAALSSNEPNINATWDNQTIMLIPKDYGTKNQTAILIGRKTGRNFTMKTYVMYTEDTDLKIAQDDKGQTVMVPITKDTLIGNSINISNSSLAKNQTARLGVLIKQQLDKNGKKLPPIATKLQALPGLFMQHEPSQSQDFDF